MKSAFRYGIASFSILAAVPAGAHAQPAPAVEDSGAEEEGSRRPIIVTATRSGTALENLPVSVSVLDDEDLQDQVELNRNIVSALEFAVPGLSVTGPDRAACSVQVRSRQVAFQINGVPVNEDLRQGSCTGPFTITPFAIERVEVVRGGTALYGSGSPGGIINLITRRGNSPELQIDAVAQTSFNTNDADRTFTTDLYAGLGQQVGNFDYYVGLGYTDGGLERDASGRPAVSRAFEAFDAVTSLGLRLGDGELRFTGTYHDEDAGREFSADGTFIPGTDFGNVVPITPHPFLDQAGDRNVTASLSYRHPALLAHDVTLSLFYQDQEIIQRDNFFSAADGDFFFASNRENSRFGIRSTFVRSYDIGAAGLKTSYGLDYTRNDFQRFIVDPANDDEITGYITPAFFLRTLALFGQLELQWGRMTLTGGLRHEWYSGAIEEEGFDPTLSRAATPGDFADSELSLWNAGAVYRLAGDIQLYASFSQGAELSQLGRAARGATDPSLISNAPATSDQYEAGVRGTWGPVRFGLAAYYAESDSSSQIQPDPSCAGQPICPLIPLRIPERAHGLEADAEWRLTDDFSLSGVFTLQRGQVLDPDTGEFIDFSTERAVPLRITVRADWQPIEPVDLGLQLSHFGSSSYFSPNEEAIGFVDTEAYTLLSASAGYDFGPARVYLAADNLLDESYVNPFVQVRGFFTNFLAPGRRVTLGIRGRF